MGSQEEGGVALEELEAARERRRKVERSSFIL